MKPAIKAALLSGLIFPGLGQLLLKFYKTGIVLIVISFSCVVTIITLGVQQALTIVEKIESQGLTPDNETIARIAQQTTQPQDSLMINIAMLILVSCWLTGIIHGYLKGKTLDPGAQE